MKITRSQLKQIIKEEIKKAIYPQPPEDREEYERAKEEYNLQNVKVQIDELEEGVMSTEAYVTFQFGDEDLRLEDKEEKLEFPIRDILDDNRIYPETLEVKDNYISLAIRPDRGHGEGLEGFHGFMREMSEIDKIYDDVERELTELLEREGMFQQEMDLDVEEEPLRLSAPQPGSSERMRQGLRRQKRPRSPGDFRSTKDRWEV